MPATPKILGSMLQALNRLLCLFDIFEEDLILTQFIFFLIEIYVIIIPLLHSGSVSRKVDRLTSSQSYGSQCIIEKSWQFQFMWWLGGLKMRWLHTHQIMSTTLWPMFFHPVTFWRSHCSKPAKLVGVGMQFLGPMSNVYIHWLCKI
jgi:hypothetical protein